MIFTVPNLVSALRILATPVFLWLLIGADRPAAAGWVLVAIGASDWVDGYLARRLDQVSELGKMLDPVADRLAIAAALIGGWIAGVIPWWVSLLLITREVLLAVLTAYLAWRRRARIEVRYWGKVATWAVYGGTASFYIYAGTGWAFFHWWAWIYTVPALLLYYFVALQYLGDARMILGQEDAPVSSG